MAEVAVITKMSTQSLTISDVQTITALSRVLTIARINQGTICHKGRRTRTPIITQAQV